MKKLLNKPWFVVVLAVAAVVLVAQSLLDSGATRPRPAAPAPAAVAEDYSEEGEGLPAAHTSLTAALAELQLSDALPDPFAPRHVRRRDTAEPEERAPDIVETVKLTAIWEQGQRTYALLNGRILHPGESLGRITLASVESEGVWLSHWKGRDFVRLGQEFTLTTPASQADHPETAHHEG